MRTCTLKISVGYHSCRYWASVYPKIVRVGTYLSWDWMKLFKVNIRRTPIAVLPLQLNPSRSQSQLNLHRCFPQKGSLNLHLWTAAFAAVHPPSPCVGLSRRQSRTTETAAVSHLPLTHLQRKTLPWNAIPNVLCRWAKLSIGKYGRLHSSIPNGPWRQQKRRNGIPSKSLWKASIPNMANIGFVNIG